MLIIVINVAKQDIVMNALMDSTLIPMEFANKDVPKDIFYKILDVYLAKKLSLDVLYVSLMELM